MGFYIRALVYPEQNAMAERKHQHVLNVVRCLMFQSKLSKVFWSYAVNHVTHLINRLPTSVLNNRSPYEVLHGTKPDISYLKVFGCIIYMDLNENKRSKLDPRSRKCIFLG